jgi:hypothetical protein
MIEHRMFTSTRAMHRGTGHDGGAGSDIKKWLRALRSAYKPLVVRSYAVR